MEHVFSGRRFPAALGVVTLAVGVFAVCIGLRVGGTEVTLWVDDSFTPLAALIACVLCVRARARYAGRMRLFWSLLGCATALWTIAEVIWGYYALILHVAVPVASWADVGYLGAIPFAVAALIAHPAARGSGARKARSLFDGLIVAAALLSLSWTLVLGPLWHSTNLSTLGGVVALAYPFGDVVIVFFIVLALRRKTREGRLSLWCLLAGLLAMAVTDSSYAYLTGVTSYTSPGLIDTGWVAAYLGIALAAFTAEVSTSVELRAESPRPLLVSLISPLVPVLLALGVIAVEIRLGHHLDQAAWLMALGLVVLVLARQILILIELFAPGHTQGGPAQRLEHAALRDPAEMEPVGAPGRLR
jgi:hypothetical protein